MSGSVAKRCADDGFIRFITDFLCGKLQLTSAQLVTFMSGSVAKRCKDAAFIKTIKTIHEATDISTIIFLYGKDSFASRSIAVGPDLLTIVAHIRKNVPCVANNPSEIARMFGKSALYKVVGELKAVILAIDDPDTLHATFHYIRNHTKYSAQKELSEKLLRGHFPPRSAGPPCKKRKLK
jgi:hypothetical protein